MAEEQPPEETPTRVTDKRGQKKQGKEMPTAQQLLDQTPETPPPATEGETTFERQQREAAEDARRAAEFEAMSPEEQQALLAEQAAAAEGSLPYAGGGVQTDGETRQEILSAFVIVIGLDGTAHAMPLEEFDVDKVDIQREVTSRMMYRSCSEIMLDIEAAETAHMTLQMFKTVGDMMSAQQRQQALAQQLQKRGGPRGR